MCSGFGRAVVPAEEICPSSLCPLVKSSLGMGMLAAPVFRTCDVLITPATCDGKRKLSEWLARDHPTWLLDLPHSRDTSLARELWVGQLQLLRQRLQGLTGRRITRERLQEAVSMCNQKRAAARRLYRMAAEAKIWGRDMLLVMLLSFFDEPSRWAAQVAELCAELQKREPIEPGASQRPRLLLTGSPILLPTWKLPRLIEESGGLLVVDELCTGGKALWDPARVHDDRQGGLMAAVAERTLMMTCPCFTPNSARVNRLLQMARESGVDGVVYHVLTGCHLYGMEVWQIEEVLSKAGIPMLKIETDYGEEDVEQIRTRLEAFLEMLSIRKGG